VSDAYVSTGKWEALRARMQRLGVEEAELVERFVLGGGPGGQKVNKTSSCVFLRHAASGIEVKCQRSRSRDLNRYRAREELCERLCERIEGEHSRRRALAAKIRRQKARRSRRQKQRMLEAKHRQSEKKQRRRNVDPSQEQGT
jgi:protein subunit release factor B